MTTQEQWKEEFEKQFCEDPKNPIYPSMRYWKNWNRDWNMVPTVSNVELFIDDLLAAQRAELMEKVESVCKSHILEKSQIRSGSEYEEGYNTGVKGGIGLLSVEIRALLSGEGK